MEKEDLKLILSIVVISILILFIGSIFNLWNLEGAATKCKKVPIIDCKKGMALQPKFKRGCISDYYCIKRGCGVIEKPKCKPGEFLTASFDNVYCLESYECYKPDCRDFITNLNCTKDQTLVPIYSKEGCINSYICSDINEHFKDPDFIYRINKYLKII